MVFSLVPLLAKGNMWRESSHAGVHAPARLVCIETGWARWRDQRGSGGRRRASNTTTNFLSKRSTMCLSGVGHADASRPQAGRGRHLRVGEGEHLLAALLANRLQNEVALVSAQPKGRHSYTPECA